MSHRTRHLNTALLLRLLCEISAIVLVTRQVTRSLDGSWWASVLVTIGIMTVVSFVVIGVGPRTLGRQHDERVAVASAPPLIWLTGCSDRCRGC